MCESKGQRPELVRSCMHQKIRREILAVAATPVLPFQLCRLDADESYGADRTDPAYLSST